MHVSSMTLHQHNPSVLNSLLYASTVSSFFPSVISLAVSDHWAKYTASILIDFIVLSWLHICYFLFVLHLFWRFQSIFSLFTLSYVFWVYYFCAFVNAILIWCWIFLPHVISFDITFLQVQYMLLSLCLSMRLYFHLSDCLWQWWIRQYMFGSIICLISVVSTLVSEWWVIAQWSFLHLLATTLLVWLIRLVVSWR